MGNDGGKSSRDAAQRFGEKVEEAVDDLREGVDALKGKEPKVDPPDESEGDGDITININR